MIRYATDVPGYLAAHSPYSHAVIANGFVFVSGQIAVRPGGGPMDVVGTTMQEQTRQAMRNVETILKAASSGLDKGRHGDDPPRQARPDEGNERGLC
jgi:2-iminobutanoate/2-iminopropanoate deaminase